MSEERKDKLFQFVPDGAGNLKPKTLVMQGRKRSTMADGTMVEGTSVKLKYNSALQYHVRSNIADYDEALVGMKAMVQKFGKIYGKGKPGSIVEIPLSRIEKRKEKNADGKMVTVDVEVGNIGSIPEKYTPKSDEQKLRERVAELEAKEADGDSGAKIDALETESSEKSEKIKKLLADIEKMKAVNAKK